MNKNFLTFYDAVADLGAGAMLCDTEEAMQALADAYDNATDETILTPDAGYEFEDTAMRLGFNAGRMPKFVHILNYPDGQVFYVTFKNEY